MTEGSHAGQQTKVSSQHTGRKNPSFPRARDISFPSLYCITRLTLKPSSAHPPRQPEAHILPSHVHVCMCMHEAHVIAHTHTNTERAKSNYTHACIMCATYTLQVQPYIQLNMYVHSKPCHIHSHTHVCSHAHIP